MVLHSQAGRVTTSSKDKKDRMHQLHPIAIFIYFFGMGLLCIVLFHPLYLLLSLCMLLLQVFLFGVGRELRRWWLAYVVIAVMILIWNPLFSHRGETNLFYIKDIPIVLESVVYGFTMMLMIMSVLILFLNYNALMDSLKFLYLFSRYAPKLAVMIAMAVRFVPLLRRRLTLIMKVQRTRGITVSEGQIRERLKHGLQILQVVFVWSLDEALQTADSIDARGYGTKKRSSYARYTLAPWDLIFLILMLNLLVMCFIGWFYGMGRMEIYPSLVYDGFSGLLEWIHFICFFLYLCIPFMIKGKEQLMWRLSK